MVKKILNTNPISNKMKMIKIFIEYTVQLGTLLSA